MPDTKPLSDNQADDALKAALAALGEAPGATVRADTALAMARQTLWLISIGLIARQDMSTLVADGSNAYIVKDDSGWACVGCSGPNAMTNDIHEMLAHLEWHRCGRWPKEAA